MSGPLLGRCRRNKKKGPSHSRLLPPLSTFACCSRFVLLPTAYCSRLLLLFTVLAYCSHLMLSRTAFAYCCRLLLSPIALVFCTRFKVPNPTAKKTPRITAVILPSPCLRARLHQQSTSTPHHKKKTDLSSQVVIVHGHTPRREKRHARGFDDDRSEVVVGAEGNIMTSAAGSGVQRWPRKGVGGQV